MSDVLMSDTITYRERIRELGAEEKRLGEIIEQRDVDCAKILAERDEARATKDMHKERQEEYLAEVARLRDALKGYCDCYRVHDDFCTLGESKE